MANRFDTPAQHKFINTYTPIPFAELAAAGQARQGRYDQNAARIDDTQLVLDQVRTVPNSPDQLRLEGWRNQLSEFADEFINKDYSDPEIDRKIRKGIKQIVNPNELQAMQQSAMGHDNYQKTAQQMQARGEQVYNPQDFSKWDSLDPSMGIFTGSPVMDVRGQASDKIAKFLQRPQAEEEGYFEPVSGRYGTRKRRDIEKIYDLIDTNSEELMADMSIQQFMESEGMTSPDQFKQYLAGLAPQYEVEDIGSLAWRPGYGGEDKADGIPSFPFVEMPSTTTGEIDIAEAARDRKVKFDEQGTAVQADITLDSFDGGQRNDYLSIRKDYTDKIHNEWERIGEDFSKANKPVFGEGRRRDWRKTRKKQVRETRGLYEERDRKLKEFTNDKLGGFDETITKITDLYPQLAQDGKASQEEIWESYNQVMDDIEQVSIPSVAMPEEFREGWGEQLADQFAMHSMYIEDPLGKSSAPTGANSINKGSVMDELGWDASEFKQALDDKTNNDISVAGFAVGSGSEPGQIILGVKDKKNKNKNAIRTVYMSTNLTNRAYMEPIMNVYNVVKSGRAGNVSLGYLDGTEILLKNEPRIVKDPSTGLWNYEPVLKRGPAGINEQGEKDLIGDFEYISYDELVEEYLTPLLTGDGLAGF